MADNRIEREAVHPLALAVLDNVRKGQVCAHMSTDVINDEERWFSDNCKLLTPRTKAVLESVEEAMRNCEVCKEEYKRITQEEEFLLGPAPRRTIEGLFCNACPLAGIRQAYEKGERHES